MKVIYIKEMKSTCNFIQILELKLKKIFNIIKVENTENNIFYCLPIFKNGNISEYRTKKICKKIKKMLEQKGENTVALSKHLNGNQLFKSYLYSNNINIINGRYLFKCLTQNILEYIFDIQKKQYNLRRSYYFS